MKQRTPAAVLCLSALALVLLWPARAACAQEKVAEGEYRITSVTAGNAAMDHWILYARKQGGYRLESEVSSAAQTGAIVIQTEELDDQLSPMAISLRLYTREDTKKPFSTLTCRLEAEQIGCKAGGEELALDSSVDQKGPVLFAVTNLEHVDMMWMMAGAIRRAHFDGNKTNVPTLVLQDGEDGPVLAQTEVDVLRQEGDDAMEILGAKLPARRYSLENSKIKCWLAASGLPLRMENEEGAVIRLEKFKQYKKLVPELP